MDQFGPNLTIQGLTVILCRFGKSNLFVFSPGNYLRIYLSNVKKRVTGVYEQLKAAFLTLICTAGMAEKGKLPLKTGISIPLDTVGGGRTLVVLEVLQNGAFDCNVEVIALVGPYRNK